MSTDTQDRIGSIFLDTVETLTFMFGDPVEKEDVPHMDVEWSQARLDFEGAKSGYLALTVPSDVCAEIAANIMGMDVDEVTDESVSIDALKELLNVVSGHIVPSLQGEDNDFRLSVPTLVKLDGNLCYDLKDDPGTTCFNLDGNPVILTLKIV